MLIELHSHHMTPKMFDLDHELSPRWEGREMVVGSWVLRQKRFPEMQRISPDDPGTKIFERMDHAFRREMMAELGSCRS